MPGVEHRQAALAEAHDFFVPARPRVREAPYLLAGGGKDLTGEEKATEAQLAHMDVLAVAEGNRPLIGTEARWA